MDKMVLRIFQTEVERQCRFFPYSFQDLNAGLQNHDNDCVWYSVQSFLVAIGNISKMLWRPSKEFAARGDELRASLLVNDDSPLSERAFRNHFEHFDERLEAWATSTERHNFVDSNIGLTGMISGPVPGDYLWNFDTTLFAVNFRGIAYTLKPIAEAVQDLWKIAFAKSKKTFWE